MLEFLLEEKPHGMSEQAARHIERPQPLALTRAAVRYREGVAVLMHVDNPQLTDCFNAAFLLFGDQPGALEWH